MSSKSSKVAPVDAELRAENERLKRGESQLRAENERLKQECERLKAQLASLNKPPAARRQQLWRRWRRAAKPLTAEAVEASHMQLMTSLGKKHVMNEKVVEGVSNVEFSPTFFGDTAKAVKNPTLPAGRQSWGYTTDFAPFEKHLWPLFKELVEGTMAVEKYSGPKQYFKGTYNFTPEWEALLADKEAAIKVAKAISLSFWTTVLATVRVPGWRAPWMLMVLYLILVSYPTCGTLYLNGLKGGSHCDCEISFIRAVMRGLGFKCERDGYFYADKKFTQFSWIKERPDGAPAFYVYLAVHHDPDDIDVETICRSLHPLSRNATAPNLKRLAVVSAPVTDGRGERADERLNAALGKALEMMQERVKAKGFYENKEYGARAMGWAGVRAPALR